MKWDSNDWRKLRDAKLEEWLGEDGAKCIVLLSTVSETWDDLIDRDKPVSGEEVTNAFLITLVQLDLNPFWKMYKSYLFPVMVVGINAWLDANYINEHKADRKHLMLAFYIRNYAAELVQIAAFCVGGFEHMRKVSLEVREFLNHETYFEWENRHVD